MTCRYFLEIEPVDEPGAPNPHQRQRRLRFYEKNGFELTNMLTEESGDTYRVLRRGAQAAKVRPKTITARSKLYGFRGSTLTCKY